MKRNPFLPVVIFSLGVIYASEALDQSTATRPEDASATATLSQTLKAAGTGAASVVVPSTVAAIQSLGPEATAGQISALVYTAVRATPDRALDIVRAAVKLSPAAAPDIAAAAARAVPNPWKEVRYQRGGHPQPSPQANPQLPPQPPGPKEPDFKSPKERDFKSPPVDSSLLEPVEEVFDPAAPGDPMSVAEAIVQAAVDAGGNLPAVQAAVDSVLIGDPGSLFSKVGDPRSISGVGDAGNSNYANEPHDPGSKKKLVTPRNPNPNPVSR